MLTVYTLEQCPAWDAVVQSFDAYDVFYLSGYAKAFALHGDGTPLLFYYEGEGLRAINVVMKRDIADDARFAGQLAAHTWFDFVTPYGYGGWLTEGDGTTVPLYCAYMDWCKDHAIVCEFVRFLLFSNTRESYYGQVIPRTNNIVRSLDMPLDSMQMDFEHKVRKNIKRATASGLTVEVDTTGHRLDDFLAIYYDTMKRNNAETGYYFSPAFYRQLQTMTGHFVYFHALLDGKVVSTELVLLGSDTMYSYLGGTDDACYGARPNDFLKYEIIKWGHENGYSRFVLGGGYGADDGIFRYKKSFAPQGVVPFYTGQMVFDAAQYDALCAMREDLHETMFFPKYRA